MKKNMRWMAAAVLLVIAATACRESLVQPDGPASLDRNGIYIPDSSSVPDDTIEDTGYFGSGHYEPGNPPPDTTPK